VLIPDRGRSTVSRLALDPPDLQTIGQPVLYRWERSDMTLKLTTGRVSELASVLCVRINADV
jgi:hypothetical protein